jgi:hypothetical protein
VFLLAVPSGYVWAREIDPNAVYQGGVLKALGRTYKPGEFYMEGGRAYIPNPVPEGAQWIRSYFPGGQVSYNPATGMIELPGGLKLQRGSLTTVGGKTYATPAQLAQAYKTYAATYQPKQPTAEEVRQQSQALMEVYGPLMDAVRERIGLNLKKIQEQADQQRRLAEAAYQTALANTQRKETADWNRIVKSALTRGLGASPLTSYEQRKVVEAYAPEYQQLETNRAATLANIASQAALSAEELAMQGRELEAQWASKIAEYAYNALQSSASEQKKAIQNLADYFATLAENEAKAQQEAAKLAWEKEKAYIPYRYLKPAEQLEQLRWEAEWPYKQAQYQYNLNKPYYKPEETQQDLTGIFYELGTGYKSPYDFKADLQRYASAVTRLIGTKNYQQLLKYLDEEQEKWETKSSSAGGRLTGQTQSTTTPWGVRFVPGMKSPLREWLKQQGYIK